MKRALSLILALLLVSALALPAVAADNTTTVTVTYTAPETTYTLQIPSAVTATTEEFIKVGMPKVSSSTNFYNQHLDVTASLSPFVGQTNNQKYYTSIKVACVNPDTGALEKDNGGNQVYLDGAIGTESADSAVTMTFQNVTGGGALESDKAWVTMDDGNAHFLVDSLCVYNNLSGVHAPSDTYVATITFNAVVKAN